MYISVNNHKIDKTKILSLIQSQKKLTAIKYVREQLHIGLRESKDIVENLEKDPTYYDGKNHVTDMIPPELLSDASPLNNPQFKTTIRDHTNRSTSLIQKTKNNTKTYIIIGLVICIIVLAYFYSIK